MLNNFFSNFWKFFLDDLLSVPLLVFIKYIFNSFCIKCPIFRTTERVEYTVKNFLKFDAHLMQNLERKFIFFHHDLILMHFFMKLGNICMKINVCI